LKSELKTLLVVAEPWLLQRPELPIGVKMVYFAVCACRDPRTGRAEVTQQEISEMLAMSDRHVRSALQELRRLRLVDWTRTGNGHKRNAYTVHHHSWQQLAPRSASGRATAE
jgi:MarR-like DNA-binding transcriptional regulator SgrR of sgrS sRNA